MIAFSTALRTFETKSFLSQILGHPAYVFIMPLGYLFGAKWGFVGSCEWLSGGDVVSMLEVGSGFVGTCTCQAQGEQYEVCF